MTFIRLILFHLIFHVTIQLLVVGATDDFKIVNTEYGLIRGQRRVTLFDQKNYYSYRGIPYAESPQGELRFKPPEKPKHWQNVRDAVQFGDICLQIRGHDDAIVGSEDCLYLNVYVPESLENKTYSVMVFIHGGGFTYGSGDIYGPDFFIENDVILVTLNYRLGILGFLSMGTTEYSGNMGLKDQLEAFKWINRNIEQFGGNKNQITIFGESAGAVSVHMHLLSPKSRGLFQRVILQSGTSYNIWSYYSRSNHTDLLPKLAKSLGSKAKIKSEYLSLLQMVDPRLLIKETNTTFYKIGSDSRMSNCIWAPVIEGDRNGSEFLSKYPEEYQLESTDEQIDLLVGITTFESYFDIAPEILDPVLLKPFNQAFQLQLPYPTVKFELSATKTKSKKKPKAPKRGKKTKVRDHNSSENTEASVAKPWSQQTSSWPQQTNSWSQQSNSSPQPANSWSQQSNSSPQESNSSPEQSDSSPEQSNSSAQQSNSSPEQTNSSPQKASSWSQQSSSSPQKASSWSQQSNSSPQQSSSWSGSKSKSKHEATTYMNMTNEVREFYFPNKAQINNDTLDEYRDLMDDIVQNFAQYKAAARDVKRGINFKLYFYMFSMVTDLNVARKLSNIEFPGSTHTDDLFYMFRMTNPNDPHDHYDYEKLALNSIEVEAIKNITLIWTNFAKFGNPNSPTFGSETIFAPVTVNQFNFVNITNNAFIPDVNPYQRRMQFWDNLYQKYKETIDSYSSEKLLLY